MMHTIRFALVIVCLQVSPLPVARLMPSFIGDYAFAFIGDYVFAGAL